MLSLRLKPISVSLSPNVQRDDVWLTFRLLIKSLFTSPPSPLSLLRRGGTKGGEVAQLNPSPQALEQKFKEYLNAKYAFSFNSGRSASYVIMKALDIKEGDEVLLQAFTCNAVPNPVLWVGGTPVYVDIDESLNIDPKDLAKKISAKSKAVIIQHTFGVPAQIGRILDIARRYNLVVIEDCAHALGAEYCGKKVGTFGDVAFFSFGRDKVISAVWGGMITTNNENFAKRIGDIYKDLPYPSRPWTLKQLLHPILFSVIIPTYYIFGKYLLAFLRIIRGIGLAVSQKERIGGRPDMFPAKIPEALAELALHQFRKLEKYNAYRRKIAELYFSAFRNSLPRVEGAIYLRFNVRHPNAKKIIAAAKRHHILLGDWYKNIIDPIGTDFGAMKYTLGSCPNAERVAGESINLPTHINISIENAKRIVQYLRNYR